MQIVRARSLVLLLGVLCLGRAPEALAQLEVEPESPEQQAFNLRVINDMQETLTIKIAGRRARGFSVDLGPGQSASDTFWGGQRAVCAWDRHGNLKVLAMVFINRSGKLRVRPIFVPKAREPGKPGAPAAKPARSAFPVMPIE